MKLLIRYSILLFTLSMFTLVITNLSAAETTTVRVATFNIASGLSAAGELDNTLASQDDQRLLKIAAIIQKTRPDILLLNEFDFNSELKQARLFQQNYLTHSQYGEKSIDYPYSWSGPVNTGLQSGLDLNNNGKNGEPADAWGFGVFPGQYGMQVLSRYPINEKQIRSFQKLRWGDMPNALKPIDPQTGKPWYPDSVWQQLRLSSKSHWDIPIEISGKTLHLLAMHPTPPVFDGPEDHNGRRNHDEIRLFADYIDPQRAAWIIDDNGKTGGLANDSLFVIAGDLNADPADGDSTNRAIDQLIKHKGINSQCIPLSKGAVIDSRKQAGINLSHEGDPAADTGKFNPKYVGNLRLDYVLPASQIEAIDCGVFWPAVDASGAEWIDASDHHLVWIDLKI